MTTNADGSGTARRQEDRRSQRQKSAQRSVHKLYVKESDRLKREIRQLERVIKKMENDRFRLVARFGAAPLSQEQGISDARQVKSDLVRALRSLRGNFLALSGGEEE